MTGLRGINTRATQLIDYRTDKERVDYIIKQMMIEILIQLPHNELQRIFNFKHYSREYGFDDYTMSSRLEVELKPELFEIRDLKNKIGDLRLEVEHLEWMIINKQNEYLGIKNNDDL